MITEAAAAVKEKNLFCIKALPAGQLQLAVLPAAATIRCNVSFANAAGGNVVTSKRNPYSSAADDDDKGDRPAKRVAKRSKDMSALC